jgi:hypothetical protein
MTFTQSEILARDVLLTIATPLDLGIECLNEEMFKKSMCVSSLTQEQMVSLCRLFYIQASNLRGIRQPILMPS